MASVLILTRMVSDMGKIEHGQSLSDPIQVEGGMAGKNSTLGRTDSYWIEIMEYKDKQIAELEAEIVWLKKQIDHMANDAAYKL